jgi:hypothetical protein
MKKNNWKDQDVGRISVTGTKPLDEGNQNLNDKDPLEG